METTHHTNGHSTVHVKKAAHAIGQVARKAKTGRKKVLRASHRLERKAESTLLASNQALSTATRGIVSWVKANPKTAIGLGLGVSGLIGALASSRLVRATALGLSGLALTKLRRFI
jgi:ElaB/YqjD/DUF883 family membrane-anchored ribosome-binding protein